MLKTDPTIIRYEGDNYILTQQVCRAAVKAYAVHVKSGKRSTGIASYLNSLNDAKNSKPSWETPKAVAQLLARRAAVMVEKFAKIASKTKVWTDLSWRAVPLSNAVTEAFISEKVAAAASEPSSKYLRNVGSQESAVLKRLTHFVSRCGFVFVDPSRVCRADRHVGHSVRQNLLVMLEKAITDLLEHQILHHEAADRLRQDVERLAKELVPSSLALTDAFDFSDWELNSTLGRVDGQPYEALLERAQATEKYNLGDKAFKGDLHAIFQQGRLRAARQAKL